MGQIQSCLSNLGVLPEIPDIVPSQEEITELVTEKIPEMGENYATYVIQYKRGMERCAPKPYVCEEVLSKEGEDGKLTLTLGVDDEKAVKTAALLATTNEDVRSHIKDEVWETVEPSIAEKADVIPHEASKNAALKGARMTVDKVVDKYIDDLFDSWAKKIKNGEAPFENAHA